MGKVYVKFPKTGLGNMLIVWANALVFAELNGLPLVTGSWWGFRWGALLRAEKRKRLYFGYFKESSLSAKTAMLFSLLNKNTARNPAIKKVSEVSVDGTDFLFDELKTHERMFLELEPYKDLICQNLYSILNPLQKKRLDLYELPVIGVHIRRGDFSRAGLATGLDFFIEAVKGIREVYGEHLPVTIFSDALPSEIREILDLPNVELSGVKPDILDILLLSKSRFLIISQSSSFSYWAAFLSGATVIMKYNDWQEGLKTGPGSYREIRFNPDGQEGMNVLKSCLRNNIKPVPDLND